MTDTVGDMLGEEQPNNQSTTPPDGQSSAQIYAAVDETVESLTQGFGSPATSPEAKEVKQALNFGASSGPEDVPATPPHAPTASARADVDYYAFTKDTLLWKSPVRSAIYLLSGVVAVLVASVMLGHDIPVLTVIAYLTLAQMALNFLRHAIDPSLQQKATWLDSAWTAAAIQQIGDGVKALAAVHDRHLSAGNPHKHLIIAMSLWLVSLLCKLVAPMTLLLCLYVGAFTVPKAFEMLKPKAEPIVKDVHGKVKAKWDAADHRVKAVAIMVTILALGFVSTIDLIIAAFVVFVFAHSQLPKEMEQLGRRVGPVLTPVGNTAAAAGSRVSNMLIGASNKFELTPTPLKAKKLQ